MDKKVVKKDYDENIVAGGPRQNHLGDAFPGAVAPSISCTILGTTTAGDTAPSTTPVKSIPTIRGSPSFRQIPPRASPTKKIYPKMLT